MVFDPSEFEAPRFDCSWIMLALGNLTKKQKSKLRINFLGFGGKK
jgi:hypothetical protein